MNRQELLVAMQHTPLPERMGNFERTRSPKEPTQLAGGEWLVVEYSHVQEAFLFQVAVQGETATFQVNQGGQVTLLNTLSVEEAGHVLRSDLLMILEDLEDEL